MSDKKNNLASLPPPVVIVFHTTGDNQTVSQSSATGSSWFYQRALTLATSASYVYGVDKTADATAKLVAATQAAPSSILRCRKVYFYGHGNDEGFMLGCGWDSSIPDYTAWLNQILLDPNSPKHGLSTCQDSKDFMDELAKHLIPNFEIGFLGCHMGNVLVGALATYLTGKGLSGKVCGYTHTYVAGLEDGTKEYNDPGQEFSDALEDDSDPKNPKIIKKQHHNKLPPYDTQSTVTA